MVARRSFLLFVGPLVLFVDDDKAQAGLRRKKGAARADDDVEPPFAHLVPHIEVLARREAAVHHSDAAREALAKAADRLRRQRDLRYESDRALAERNRPLQRRQVDFRLAAARYP